MKWTFPIAAVAVLLSVLAAEPPPPGDEGDAAEKQDGPSVGEKAPGFELTILGSDRKLRLRDLRGKPTVLIFGSYT
jgi:hypothetical protein